MVTKKKTAKRKTAKKKPRRKSTAKKKARRVLRVRRRRSGESWLWQQVVQSFSLRCNTAKKAIAAADEVVKAHRERYPEEYEDE